jgi:hypothetical protein
MDLTPEIKFAAENELEIKERVRKRVEDYFDSRVSENYHGKWDQGVLEHGSMTEAVLNKITGRRKRRWSLFGVFYGHEKSPGIPK